MVWCGVGEASAGSALGVGRGPLGGGHDRAFLGCRSRGGGNGPVSPGRTPAKGTVPPAGVAGGMGVLTQAASQVAMTIIEALRQDGRGCVRRSTVFQEKNTMVLLLLEALGALLLLVFIVWWTMFSGRKKGELKDGSAHRVPDTEEKRK